MKAGFFILGLSSLMALCATSALGQEAYKNYDIGSYRLPDIMRNELDFSVNSEGKFSDMSESDVVSGSIMGNFDVTFNRYRNARTFRGTQQASVALSGQYAKDQQKAKTRYYDVGLYYTNSSRFYGDDYEGLFFETGGKASFLTEGTKRFGDGAEQPRNHTSKVLELSVPLRVGKGRIERVEDARQAIYILENLSKRKVLSRELTGEEIDAFARVISAVKNKRFFDARLRLIDEVTAVDSFLVASGALASGGAAYFTTLYDYWMYGDLFERKSGTEISGGVRPVFYYDKADMDYEDYAIRDYGTKQLGSGVIADVRLDYEKPTSLYWQHSAYAQLYGRYNYTHFDYDGESWPLTTKRDVYVAGLSGSYAFGYYPNSRTNVNFGVRENLTWQKFNERDSYEDFDPFVSSRTDLFLNLYYYFSPQLRLAAEGNLGYQYSGQENIDYSRWTGNFVLTLTYSLF